jgi:hypothetical protein
MKPVLAPPRITPKSTREYGKAPGYDIGGSVGIPNVSGMPRVAKMYGRQVGPGFGPPRIGPGFGAPRVGPRLPTEEPTGDED